MQSFWRSSGFHHLTRNDHGWLRVTPDWLRGVLARPELAPMETSRQHERRLYERLNENPLISVSEADLALVEDDDTRENFQHFLRFRKSLVDAVTLERYYLQTFRRGPIDIPPVFLDLVAQSIVRGLLDSHESAHDHAFAARAGELFFRRQRIATESGQVLCADAETIQVFADTGGFGSVGRLLAQQGTAMRGMNMDVLSHENAQLYWLADDRYKYLLDLTPQSAGTLALARLLERWVAHFLGVVVRVTPRARIDDTQWRWHAGLDVESTAILNDLYTARDVSAERQARLVNLFSLEIDDQSRVRDDVRGKSIYLALAVNEERVLKMKP